MRKVFAYLFVFVLFCSFAFGSSQPASTDAAASNTGFVLAADGKWHTVLETTIKNPTANDDLFIDVSQVTKITTTNPTSSDTPNVISSGDAKLEMRVLVDGGIVAKPGAIVFDEQLTTLTSNLQAFQMLSCTQTPTTETFTTCVCNSTTVSPAAIACDPAPAAVPSGYTRSCTTQTDHDIVTTCSLSNGSPQTLATLLAETLGHSYDFFVTGVGGGGVTHDVKVQEKLTQTTNNGGTAEATIGPGTIKITAVNLK